MNRPTHGGNLRWAAEIAQCAPNDLLDFSASISPLGPPRSVREAVRAAFSSVMAYPDPDYVAIREIIGQHHNLPIEYVFLGNGAAELLNWAARDLATLDEVFYLSPGFSDYQRALKAFGCVPSPISLFNRSSSYQSDWETQLESKLGSSRQGLLLNNPHNPTGQLFSRSRVQLCRSQLNLLVVDEAFMDFLPEARSQSAIPSADDFSSNLVIIRSLTKFYSIPGIRLGYAIAHPDRLKQWQQWRDPWSVNNLAVAAGIAGLQDVEFQQRSWNWLDEERPFLFKALSNIEALEPMEGSVNFLLIKCKVSTTALQRKLLQQHKVYIRDCMSFEDLGDRFFRVAVKTREDNQRLIDALTDVLADME